MLTELACLKLVSYASTMCFTLSLFRLLIAITKLTDLEFRLNAGTAAHALYALSLCSRPIKRWLAQAQQSSSCSVAFLDFDATLKGKRAASNCNRRDKKQI